MKNLSKSKTVVVSAIMSVFVLGASAWAFASHDNGDRCRASLLQKHVGQHIDEVEFSSRHHSNRRVFEPGTGGTMDYVPTRLNVVLDENGVVTRVSCH